MIKNKKNILIIWGLFFSITIIGLLSFIPLTFAAQISYHPNGTIDYIYEYDPQTGNKTKYTEYNLDGTIDYIYEYDPQTGNKIKYTEYDSDGKTFNYIYEYDPQTGNKTKETYYNSNGTIASIDEYNPDGTFKKEQIF
ncbi:DUF2963 domain-containing protein [Hydrangea phyllody phytoplasma]|uniref:DUF2963 domain-containing protein n=1 Tax=Hydrangea phyllody phytoplasma TaxID=238673 RepID=UPI002D2112E8|nr:hypothetical protein HP2P_1740 [Hydrangea phyllody phytoplasma]